MEPKKNILTYEGLRKYEDELEHLKVVKRKEISQKIKEAREQGDLSENAEYDAAKDEQRDIEARIEELEKILKNAEVVDSSDLSTDKVSFGSVVTLQNTATKAEFKYKIVGDSEVDFKNKKISDRSPVGKAIMGQKKGKTVSVSAPSGVIKYKIVKIEM